MENIRFVIIVGGRKLILTSAQSALNLTMDEMRPHGLIEISFEKLLVHY